MGIKIYGHISAIHVVIIPVMGNPSMGIDWLALEVGQHMQRRASKIGIANGLTTSLRRPSVSHRRLQEAREGGSRIRSEQASQHLGLKGEQP
jgi:hypothetical protein